MQIMCYFNKLSILIMLLVNTSILLNIIVYIIHGNKVIVKDMYSLYKKKTHFIYKDMIHMKVHIYIQHFRDIPS